MKNKSRNMEDRIIRSNIVLISPKKKKIKIIQERK